MCTYSMIVDHYREKWTPLVPTPVQPVAWPPVPQITPAELDEFRRLLDRAREYDKQHHEPDCELEEKKAAIRKVAEQLGVEIAFL